ncbi:hypothetical protein PPYR_09095 [Photinus pyralis]|uniref:Succinate dehydrogenase assembly factor 4, mitochondrial n=1 Tax=Photinus pyralis TaxID=7054 RepID=A0A1Y1KPU2_PHOPY|nr:succinate dehydrogenase assembly factor 4, mitochondrial-like [Photinus pyralis]XP_031344965.1 succinate dehydrogenase assembly factor 4, mitochondrial-like [Photinus pyralis]KAB0797545.1 hypothetical protein PPYR_08538 [Photinus pyralis]KAB0798102.1 hypothetical protein PPYR_09095 [Photinus pyralis]
MSLMMYLLRHSKNSTFLPKPAQISDVLQRSSSSNDKPLSPRMQEFREKLRREKTPITKLEELEGPHPHQEKEPLPPWPNNTNPHTGEVGGPRGPEPTRYGDWERKGRVSDF